MYINVMIIGKCQCSFDEDGDCIDTTSNVVYNFFAEMCKYEIKSSLLL